MLARQNPTMSSLEMALTQQENGFDTSRIESAMICLFCFITQKRNKDIFSLSQKKEFAFNNKLYFNGMGKKCAVPKNEIKGIFSHEDSSLQHVVTVPCWT